MVLDTGHQLNSSVRGGGEQIEKGIVVYSFEI